MKLTSHLPKILLLAAIVASQSGAAPASPASATTDPIRSVSRPVREWYLAWENKDWNRLEQVLADGFTFSSPLDDHIDVKHVKERCWPNAYNIKRFQLERVVVNGDDTFVVSDGWTLDGKLFRNCDYFRVRDGKIVAYECFFGPGISFPNSGK